MPRVADAEALRTAFSVLIRSLGVLRPDTTPCGEEMSVSEAHAIDELHDRGPRSQHALGAALRLQKSTISRLVDQLVERGWAERVADDGDGRVSLVRLTALGRRRADRLASARRRLFAELLDSIPEAEHAVVISALTRLAEAAEAAEATDARV